MSEVSSLEIVQIFIAVNKDEPVNQNLTIFTILDYRHWEKVGQEEILRSLEASRNINTNLAKNVIIFVGDGMSLPTLTASRIYQAQLNARLQKKKVNGEENLLFFETFPHVGLSKVPIFLTTYVA